MALVIPRGLAATCRSSPERAAWLERLPQCIRSLQRQWNVTLGQPFDGNDISAAWVAPAALPDETID